MPYIDLRSDTVTKPTPAMREAMAKAEVGDDVYLEDPTVNHLQERAAALLGFEAALFVPTGTMGNQICVKLHTSPGQEVILDAKAHIYNWEVGMMTAFSGALPRLISTRNGHPSWDEIAAVVQPPVYYRAQTALVCLENTHNMWGGTVMSAAQTQNICEQARTLGLRVHIDGARLFNAAVALNLPVEELAHGADTVMFCLSKGLGAPAGSIICGSRAVIERARVLRKMLGGGMRQVGVLAAAGLVALDEGPQLITEDHVNAKRLAARIARIPGVLLDPSAVVTNIVIFDVSKTGLLSAKFCEALAKRNILAGPVGATEVRFVTHRDVGRAECEAAAEAVAAVAAA
jgi:threonine aldolase